MLYEEPRMPVPNMEPPDEEEDDTPRCLYCHKELPENVATVEAMADEYCSQTCAYNDGIRDARQLMHKRLANVRHAKAELDAALLNYNYSAGGVGGLYVKARLLVIALESVL